MITGLLLSVKFFQSYFNISCYNIPIGGDIMKLLLAEDEKRMAKALIELLRLEKYDVDHVEDGISALERL